MCRAWHNLDADLQWNNREARGAKVIFTTSCIQRDIEKTKCEREQLKDIYGRLLIEYYCSLPLQYIVYSVTDWCCYKGGILGKIMIIVWI